MKAGHNDDEAQSAAADHGAQSTPERGALGLVGLAHQGDKRRRKGADQSNQDDQRPERQSQIHKNVLAVKACVRPIC